MHTIRILLPWLFYPGFFVRLVGFTPKYIDTKGIEIDEKLNEKLKFSIVQLLVANIGSLVMTVLLVWAISTGLSKWLERSDFVVLSTLSVIALPLPLFFFIQAYLYWCFFIGSKEGVEFLNKKDKS